VTPAVSSPTGPPAEPSSGPLSASLHEAADDELLAAHAAGDPDAFGELFRRHKDRMWAVAVRTCGDREMAADAVQDGFLAAFRRADSFRGDAAVTTWLHRIVVNACIDRLRRRRPTSPLPDSDLLGDGTQAGGSSAGSRGSAGALRARDDHARDDHARTEVALDVRAALARLPEGQRLALVLVDMHGLSVAEAADVLGVAEGTVKSRCSRGRTAVAELLGLEHPGNPQAPANPANPEITGNPGPG
jgi:RNA polymerase sigma-70 factor, ECF subfamily